MNGTAASPHTSVSTSRCVHALIAAAMALLYLALMSGHLASMDGLYMARQAYALVFDHSVRFQSPVWTWRPEPTWNSNYGIGLSLLYVPGMLAAAALRARVPITLTTPPDTFEFYLRQLYEDPLYTVGGAWVHAAIVALTAYLVARVIASLGGSRRAALWGMVFYGLGSSALVYSRGDFAQPLEGLCWTAALLGAIRLRETGERSALGLACLAIAYGILTRPIEGVLMLPAAIALVLPATLRSARQPPAVRRVMALSGAALAGVAITLLINWIRFGDPLRFGYDADNGWVLPDARRWAGVLFSPGRGILWEFPALVLMPFGISALVHLGHRRVAVVVLALSAALLVNTATWYMWWGGWCWGLRLFTPAIPLLAVIAGHGVDRLTGIARRVLPAVVLLLGFAWALPGVVTDILGGYGEHGENVWQLDAYPPFGAWRFLERVFADGPRDPHAVDILWFRLAPATGSWSLLVPIVLLAIAAALVVRSRRLMGCRPC